MDATHGNYIRVVGTSQYQGTLKVIAGGMGMDGPKNRDHRGMLNPEPHNPYDPEAVRVLIAGAAHVGYPSREDACRYRPVIDRVAAMGRVIAPAASLHAGGPNDTIGVRMHLAEPDVLTAELDANPALLEGAD